MAKSKLADLVQACKPVLDGSTLGIGGITLHRRPLGLVRELIAQRKKELTLVGLTLGFEAELLLAEGCVSCVRAGYVGLDFLGLAPHFGKHASVRIVEETEHSILNGLRATLAHMDFLPARGTLHTDVARVRPDVRTVRSPYTDEEYIAWPALRPDTALVHASMADEQGNAVLGYGGAIDRLLVVAAKRTIVSTERLVSTAAIQQAGADILARNVSAVVHLPQGAHPTSCLPHYRTDIPYLLNYLATCRAQGAASAGTRSQVARA